MTSLSVNRRVFLGSAAAALAAFPHMASAAPKRVTTEMAANGLKLDLSGGQSYAIGADPDTWDKIMLVGKERETSLLEWAKAAENAGFKTRDSRLVVGGRPTAFENLSARDAAQLSELGEGKVMKAGSVEYICIIFFYGCRWT